MDRAGRFLKSVKTKLATLRVLRAEAKSREAEPIVPTLSVGLLSQNNVELSLWERGLAGERILPRLVGVSFAFAIVIIAATVGISQGGQYQSFVAQNGNLFDVVARASGFSISEISISGNKELTNAELIAVTGITSANSLPFLNVTDVQTRLKRVALVADASVRKFYPNKLVITLIEREPYALWQKDGDVKIISSDGTVIEGFRDLRFRRLPHVVGKGANLRAREYFEMIEGVPALKDKIRAGTLISDRRWNIKLTNGVDIKLPEDDPVLALKNLARLDVQDSVLDKDILAVDMRVPGRATFRLSEAAALSRVDLNNKKTMRKGKA